MATAFVALALSMFGLFDPQAPRWWRDRFGAPAAEGGSVAGAAFLGFSSALVVGPCVTPPLAAALLYVAQTRGCPARGAGPLRPRPRDGCAAGARRRVRRRHPAPVRPLAGAGEASIRPRVPGSCGLARDTLAAGRVVPPDLGGARHRHRHGARGADHERSPVTRRSRGGLGRRRLWRPPPPRGCHGRGRPAAAACRPRPVASGPHRRGADGLHAHRLRGGPPGGPSRGQAGASSSSPPTGAPSARRTSGRSWRTPASGRGSRPSRSSGPTSPVTTTPPAP